MSGESFIAIDDYLAKDWAFLHDERFALQLLTGKECRSTTSKDVEHAVADLRTTHKRTLVKRYGFLCWVFIRISCFALRKPDVDHVCDVVDGRVADTDVLVENLRKRGVFRREERLATRSIHTWLVELRERDLRSWVDAVFHPERGAFVVHTYLRIQRLEQANVFLIAVPKVVRVILGNRERRLHGFEQECAVLGIRFLIIHVTTVALLAAKTLVVVERNVERRIRVYHVDFVVTDELLHDFFVCAIAANEHVITESETVSGLNVGILRFFNFVFRAEIVLIDFEHIFPDRGEVVVVESDLQKELGIESLEKFVVPRSRVAVRAQEVFLALLRCECAIRNAYVDLFIAASECLHDLQSLMSGEYAVVGVDRGNLYEIELGNARFEVFSLLSGKGARVFDVGDEVADFTPLGRPLQC